MAGRKNGRGRQYCNLRVLETSREVVRTMYRLREKIVLTALVAGIGVMTVRGQLPIPVPGQNPAPAGAQARTGGGRNGRGPQPAAAEPVRQVVTPIPAAIDVTGPGP